MPEDLQALAVAVRRPMRRWWIRVGAWWIAVLALSLAFRIYVVWINLQVVAQQISTQTNQYYALGSMVLNLVLSPGTELMWVLAALHANRLLTDLLKTAGLADSPRFLAMRFSIAMYQAIIPISACAIFSILINVVEWCWWPISLSDRPNLWYTAYSFSCDVLQLIAMLIWFIAFLSIVHHQVRLLWIWFGLSILLKPLFDVWFGCWIVFGHPPAMVAGTYTEFNGEWTWAVGLLILVTMLEGFRLRQMFLAYPVYGFALLASLIGGTDRWILRSAMSVNWLASSWQVGLPALIDWQTVYRFLPFHVNPVSASERMYYIGAKLWFIKPEWQLISGHEAICLLAVALNIAWLALLYCFIRYIVLSPEKHEVLP